MQAVIARRLLLVVPVLLGVSVLVFILVRVVPGDPAAALAGPSAGANEIAIIRHRYNLDDPIVVQYVHWLGDALRGDLGTSLTRSGGVLGLVWTGFQHTALLAFATLLVTIMVGAPAGIIAAVYRGKPLDRLVTVVALFGRSMPVFWIGLVGVELFSIRFHLLPANGMHGTTSTSFLDLLRHMVLPSVTLGMALAGGQARIMRTSVVEVINQQYVVTARAKGLRSRTVLLRHVLRNALIPYITILGLEFGTLLAGAVVTETVFAWPGLGYLMVRSLSQRDYPVIQGAALLTALIFTGVTLLTDLLSSFLSPQSRFA